TPQLLNTCSQAIEAGLWLIGGRNLAQALVIFDHAIAEFPISRVSEPLRRLRNAVQERTAHMSRNEYRHADDSSEVVITTLMIEAGKNRLCELLEAGTGSAFVVSEAYRAMVQAEADCDKAQP